MGSYFFLFYDLFVKRGNKIQKKEKVLFLLYFLRKMFSKFLVIYHIYLRIISFLLVVINNIDEFYSIKQIED